MSRQISIEEQTLAELRIDAARQNARTPLMISPRIENGIVATDTASADQRHNVNMMQPGLPGRLSEIMKDAPFPTSIINLMVMDALCLDAPEILLSNIVSEEEAKKTGGYTLRQALARFEKSMLDTDLAVPYIYRHNPQYVKYKTVLRSEIRYLLSRTSGDERERLLQWLKRTIQDVRQTFEEKKRGEAPKGGMPFLTRR